MPRSTRITLLIVATSVGGCQPLTDDAKRERPAPPDQFVVTTAAGKRLAGPAARIDIRHVDPARPPDVEVVISASGSAGDAWSVQSVAFPDFLETRSLTAQVVDRPLEPGKASVQIRRSTEEAAAATGLLSVRLHAGRLVGEASRMSDEFSASFDGPFVVTCSVPASSMSPGGPASMDRETPPTLIVDDKFQSNLCQPYAALGGASR